MTDTRTVDIYRYDPDADERPRIQRYELSRSTASCGLAT
jgi:succinate dehydrogenase / fumarate reductase iron-sulfur subunit